MAAAKAKPSAKAPADREAATRPVARPTAVLRLPTPHKEQEIFVTWEDQFPQAQVAVFPAATKVGKTFGSSIWLLQTALINQGFYCVWIAPTLYKCRIAYRYMKAMLPEAEHFQPVTTQAATGPTEHGRDVGRFPGSVRRPQASRLGQGDEVFRSDVDHGLCS